MIVEPLGAGGRPTAGRKPRQLERVSRRSLPLSISSSWSLKPLEIDVKSFSNGFGEHFALNTLTKESMQLSFDDVRGDTWVEEPSIEKMRVLLYLNVPANAPESEVKSWLVSRGQIFSSEVYATMRQLHSGDETLRSWRVEGRESSALLN